MKQHGLLVLAAFALSVFSLIQKCDASTSDCDGATRIVGAFGAEDRRTTSLAVAADVLAQLPQVRNIRRVLDTQLSPSGEQVIVYDSVADESDPHPKIAFVVDGHPTKILDAFDLAPRGGGFDRYLSACQFDLATNERAVAVAFSTAFDGTGSAFAIIRWQSGKYRIVFNPHVAQGRIELGPTKITLWQPTFGKNALRPDSVNFECEWCLHRYTVTTYFWRNGKYVKAGSRLTTTTYDPAEVSGTPLVVRGTQTGKKKRPSEHR